MAIVSFEIVSVPVSDQQRAKRFYRDVLGFELLREELPDTVPVMFASAISDANEAIETVALRDAVASRADMRTVVLIGSSRTRLIPRANGKAFVYTPRSVGATS